MDQEYSFYYTVAKADDVAFMERILLEAAAASGDFIPADKLDSFPDTARYVRGWPRERELGIVARTKEGLPVGVAWLCLFSHLEETGSDGLIPPEITVGVLERYRNLGLGNALMKKLYLLAKQQGWKHLSLGVHKDNLFARRLYDKHGWAQQEIFSDYILMLKNL